MQKIAQKCGPGSAAAKMLSRARELTDKGEEPLYLVAPSMFLVTSEQELAVNDEIGMAVI